MDKHFFLFSLMNLFIIASSHSIRTTSREKRLVGGFDVEPNELKYLVGIFANEHEICAGGIIDDKHILTAAHCFVNVRTSRIYEGRIVVVANTTNLFDTNRPGRIEIEVDEIFLPILSHGGHWTWWNGTGDIAVLKLKWGLSRQLGSNYQALRLPTFSSHVNSEPVIASYGANRLEWVHHPESHQSFKQPVFDGKLCKAKVLVVSNAECSCYYNSIGFVFTEDHMCGRVRNYPLERNTPQGTCNGDSGAPLVLNGTEVIGILQGLSAMAECNNNVAPSIYTRVTSYLNFILNAKNGVRTHLHVEKVNVVRHVTHI